MVAVYLIGGVALLGGIILMGRAIRGRLISEHPHCRKCRFDLHGLDLGEGTKCPECGSTVTADTPSVQFGLRRFRRGLFLVALVLMLGGSGTIAWPWISKMPAIKNVDWYAKFPEGLLLMLESGGNDDAFQELHDRLIPGEVSDEGLAKLIDRAFKHQADVATPWDERWGDVLLYGLLMDKIADEQMGPYLESLIVPVLYQHGQIRMIDTSFRTDLVLHGTIRGSNSAIWMSEVFRAGVFDFQGLRYQVESTIVAKSQSGEILNGSTSTGSGGSWTPVSPVISTMMGEYELDPEHEAIDVQHSCIVRILHEGKPLHEWTIERSKSTLRVEGDIQYAQAVGDQKAANELIPRLILSGFYIPEQVELPLSKPGLHTSASFSGVQGLGMSNIAVVGTLSVRYGQEEIVVSNFSSIPLSDSMGMGVVTRYGTNWTYRVQGGGFVYRLEDFQRDDEFWNRVRERGRVDVVFRPDPDMLADLPQVIKYLDEVVIFRDVPVGSSQLQYFEDSQGWGWRSSGAIYSKQVHGE
ncbi:MAG: hypothetical protein JKY96_04355, partial [Phycisphaerales bacterium]|nr:hypothetical protein [Phycisphaerales bacterium]